MARNVNQTFDSSEGDPGISAPMNVTASTSSNVPVEAPDGHFEAPFQRVSSIDTSLLPGGYRSLSGIALHAFFLGISLCGCALSSIYLAGHGYRIWRLPEFIATLSLFHFLEFFTTARWNTTNARVSSYLLFSNGVQYNIAHLSAMLEITVTSLVFPSWQARFVNSYTIAAGLLMVMIGQTVRSVAMAQAGTNFNHIPARQKRDGHVLVTSGMYAWLRHPSYFGYYWFAVGTQLVVGNKVCGVIYALVLWRFFSSRIESE
ncbi:hypothetical protein MBLNU459_g7435t2 [Dothideomycetes sp. NU459]